MAKDKTVGREKGSRATAKEIDRLTGIRIGGKVYRENRVYTDTSLLGNFLGGTPLGGSVAITGLEAELDVSRNRLVVFASAQVSAGGFNPDLSLKFVFDGKASGRTGIARDFTAKDLVAGLYAGSGLNTELLASAEPQGNGLKLNKAVKALANNADHFPKLVDVSSVAVAATGLFASQVGAALADANLSLMPRAQVVKPFGSEFTGAWWNAGL